MSRGAFDLGGRVAIVTGAGGGLGHGICPSLAAAGAAVACVDRDSARAEEIARRVSDGGGRSLAVEADVSDPASVSAMAERVVAELGGVDILVNNAAIYPRREWTEIAPEEWDRVLGTNLRGYFLCARAVFDSMRERGGGRIVNLSSVSRARSRARSARRA